MTLDEYILSLKISGKPSVLKPEDAKNIKDLVAEIQNNLSQINYFNIQNGFKEIKNKESDIKENSSPVCYANNPEFRKEFRD